MRLIIAAWVLFFAAFVILLFSEASGGTKFVVALLAVVPGGIIMWLTAKDIDGNPHLTPDEKDGWWRRVNLLPGLGVVLYWFGASQRRR